jgi:hypothetical protein
VLPTAVNLLTSGPLVMLFAPLYHMAWYSLLFVFSLQRAEQENCLRLDKPNQLLVRFIL